MTQSSSPRDRIYDAGIAGGWVLFATSDRHYDWRSGEGTVSVSFTEDGQIITPPTYRDEDDVRRAIGPDQLDTVLRWLTGATEPAAEDAPDLEEMGALGDELDQARNQVTELEQQVAGLTAALTATGRELAELQQDRDRVLAVSETMATLLGERDAALAEALELIESRPAVPFRSDREALRVILTRFADDAPKGAGMPEQDRPVVPTAEDVAADPEYWLAGPGREVARQTDCEHGYRLTSSCPNCP